MTARRPYFLSSGRCGAAAIMLLWLVWLTTALSAQPIPTPKPVVVTNYIVITNIVIVTNYVVTTNMVLTTNGVSSAGYVASRSTKPSLPDLTWVPPVDHFDWIQLKSGEWLKGRLKAMQDRELEFDSEELDELTFDWKDIRQVRSSRIMDVLSVTGEKLGGPVSITPEQVQTSVNSPLEGKKASKSKSLHVARSGALGH